MSWTRLPDVKSQIQKLWDKGEILSSIVSGASAFPRRLTLKAPTSNEISDRFDEVRTWITDVLAMPHCRVEVREFKHRIFGKNSVPSELWIDSIESALALINKRREASRFKTLLEMTQTRHPELVGWLEKHPLRALELYEEWPKLLNIVDWMQAHPRPDIYLREVDIPGMDTKFIESHRAVLSEMFDVALPLEAINSSVPTGAKQFCQRYGFQDKPLRIRFRVLDPDCALLSSGGLQDIMLDADSFARLNPRISNVFFTENETNFLAFPEVPQSMVIFGAGYGFAPFSPALWLLHCRIHYWGDIDTHGFGILHSARSHFPHIESLLMDEETLLSHQQFWGEEASQHEADNLRWLTLAEQSLFTGLKRNVWKQNLRLEQERIHWNHACEAIRRSVGGTAKLSVMATSVNPLSASDAREAGDRLRVSGPASAVRLSDRDLSTYLRPSQCGLRVHLRHHDRAEMEQDQFTQLLQRLSRKHELAHVSRIQSVTDLSDLTEEQQIAETKQALTEHRSIIYKPQFVMRCNLGGISTEVRAGCDLLMLEGDGYVLRNVRLARRINQIDHPDIILQLQLAAWLYTDLVGQLPVRLEICNGENQIIEIENDRGRSALQHLIEILKLKVHSAEPYSPVGWSKCGGCGFNDYCWTKAQERQDVSMLIGVDQDLARALHNAGSPTIDSLLSNFDEDSLANMQRTYGARVQRVGKKAASILAMATARVSNREIILQSPELPLGPDYVIIDFEGLPPYLDDLEKVYLWGMQVFGSSPGQFIGLMGGAGIDGDRQGWNDFLSSAQTIFDQFGDIPFLHWHHYERVKIDLYTGRFGDAAGLAARVRQNLLDLLPIVQQCVALPLPSYSLKVVETLVGFQRTLPGASGNWAMARYIEAIECENAELQREITDQILTYNREDLAATHAVLQWFQKLPANDPLAATRAIPVNTQSP